MIKVFLVEDEIIIRNGIKNSIDWEMHGYDFVGEASDGELALPMILEKKPDILITDIKMPFMDGLELSEQVKKVLPATKIMILSGYNEFDYAKMAIKIGVTDYLLKPISSEKLLEAVNKVAEEIRKEQSEKEQMNQYAREMQENKEREKFQFFNQVFAGSMPFGECLEQGKQLGIEISAEGYCVILFKIIMIDHPMDYNEDIVSATEDIENLSEQTEKLLWFRRGVEGWGFIAQGAVVEELTARAQTFRGNLEKVLEKYKNLGYFGGIGSQVGRFSEIKKSYNDANRAFAERFSRSLSQFVSYSEVHQVGVQNDVEMHRLGTMAENRKMLERFLKTGTENEVNSFMDAYFDAVGEQNLQSMMLRQYIVMDTFISVQSLGDSLNIEKEDIERELGDVREVSQYVQELGATRKYLENIVRRMIRLREQASGRRYSEIIEKARDYIGQNYMSENISLNLVAASVNISPSYFSSLFSQEVGSTFVEYLTGVRMEKAKELLMCSDKRTSDIGYEVGYKDSHYFSYISVYLAVVSNMQLKEVGDGVTTVNGVVTVNPYDYITEMEEACDKMTQNATVPLNQSQARRIKNSLSSLRYCVQDLDKQIKERTPYDERMEYFNSNVKDLTTLVQAGIQDYVYLETSNFVTVQTELNRNNRHSTMLAIGVAIVAMSISLLLSGRASRSVTRPIHDLCNLTEKVAGGDFSVKTQVETGDEIAVLTRSFNDMTEEIGILVDDIRKKQENLRIIENRLLQEQINPHFLYNTLDAIVWLAEENKSAEVVKMVTSLSDFFRTTLSKGHDYITVKEERTHIESYLEIQQFRYQDILDYEIRMNEEIYGYIIPKLTLQPLVENALYHGIKNKRGKGKILITGEKQGDKIIFQVVDNGKGMTEEELNNLRKKMAGTDTGNEEKGFGVSNVNQRIKYYYGDEYGVFFESKENEGTNATIIIAAKNIQPPS